MGETLVVSQAWWDRSTEEERLAALRHLYSPFGRHYGWGPIPTEPFSQEAHQRLRAAWCALLGLADDPPASAGRGDDPPAA